MGYTIVYDKLFLRAEDKYIPICLAGSNNCTELVNGREVRERGWDTFTYGDKMLLADAEALMNEVRRIHSGSSDDCFKYRSKWLNDADVIRFFESGIKNAVTIEDVLQSDCSNQLHVYLSCWPKGEYSRKILMQERLQTSEQIIDWIRQAKDKKAELLASGDWSSIYICCGFTGREPIIVKKKLDSAYPVIAKCKSGYLCQFSDHSWTSSPDVLKAIVFESSEKAYSVLPKGADFYLVSAAKASRKKWVLSVINQGRRVYIYKLTSRRCRLADTPAGYLKTFATENEALKWYKEKIQPRFSGLTDPVPVKLKEEEEND